MYTCGNLFFLLKIFLFICGGYNPSTMINPFVSVYCSLCTFAIFSDYFNGSIFIGIYYSARWDWSAAE